MAVLKPEYLGMIPEFKGETELLPRFLSICEKVVTKFYNTTDITDFQNEYLMSSILSKIKGEAAINISSSSICTFDDLKNALLAAYADKRDLYTLNIEMTELKQGNESVFDFFNRVQQILNLQVSYVTTHASDPERTILCQYCRNLALRVLLRGLKEPIGSLMRTKNPQDLNSALNMLTNDFQIEAATSYSKRNAQTYNYSRQLQKLPQTHLSRSQLQHNPGPSDAKDFSQFQRNNLKHFPKKTTSNLSKPMSGVSSFVNRPTFPKPVPMSGISNYTTRSQVPYKSNPKFSAEELFNITETDFQEMDDQPNPDEYLDENVVSSPIVEYPEELQHEEVPVFRIMASEDHYMNSN